MGEFTNKVAVVTGGSSGIGLSIASRLNQEGARVVIFARDQKKLKTATDSLKNATSIQGDVSKISDLDRLYQKTKTKLGGIDILIANAGIAEPRHLKEVDEHFFDEIVKTDYKGLYFTVQRALPFLNRGASIILISSMAAHITWPAHSVYSSVKAAVSYLAKSFSSDLIEDGIRVNAISPGFVDTPMYDELKKSSPETFITLANNIPLKKFASVEDIANLALFLASPKSSYIIGSDIVIDGGVSAIFPARL